MYFISKISAYISRNKNMKSLSLCQDCGIRVKYHRILTSQFWKSSITSILSIKFHSVVHQEYVSTKCSGYILSNIFYSRRSWCCIDNINSTAVVNALGRSTNWIPPLYQTLMLKMERFSQYVFPWWLASVQTLENWRRFK